MIKNHYPLILLALALLVSLSITPRADAAQTPEPDPVLVGAGDIALCGSEGAKQTAKLIESIEGVVFTTGDNVYQRGIADEFRNCYDRTWGKFKHRTYPVPGNHDWATDSGAPYFAYFGENAGPAGLGYHSFDLGAWHLVMLNSNIEAGMESPQVKWLRDDLSTNPAVCTLAVWHHPLFSSGPHGNNPHMQDVWRVLNQYQVSVVITGHDHDYERFAPQDADGKLDPARGIREFVVGTGGAPYYAVTVLRDNSEVRRNFSWGVIKFTLHPASYEWDWIPVADDVQHDTGSAMCVGVPANVPVTAVP
jgi:3',5'-cyclic AMP phosphodiesterase CpdA